MSHPQEVAVHQFTRSSFIMSLFAVAISSAAMAQDAAVQETNAVVDEPAVNETAVDESGDAVQVGSTTVRFFADGGAVHQFETGVDGNKDMSVFHLSAGLDARARLNEDLGLGFRLNYGFDSYDFDGNFFGSTLTTDSDDPWSDIHTVEFAMVVNYSLTDDLGVFGGPVIKVAGESGADWDDSLTGGGVFGASYRLNSDLRLGGGLGVVSQIEDDVRVFPIIIVEWAFADDWRISSNSFEMANYANGIELVYDATEKWQFALGGGFRHARFRLDDEGIAPDGVGQEESLPIWFRTSWAATSSIRVGGVIGLVTNGELRVENNDGDNIESVDYDSTWMMGIFGRITF